MKLRALLIALPILFCSVPAAYAEVSISIGINVPVYPSLVLVPGYPVYYDPRADSNYFFYDGLYWVYEDDNWYASSWYNGPWELTRPEYVPLFVLRVPVRYYRQPPPYFRGWRADAPPRWDDHWGHDWERDHRGWDRWDRREVPAAAPLPKYQRQYSGDRYPRAVQQQEAIRSDRYHYQPREAVTRQHLEQRRNEGRAHNERQEQSRPQVQPPQHPQMQPPMQQRPEPQDGRRNEQRPQMPAAQPAVRLQPQPEAQPHANQPPPRGPEQRPGPRDNRRDDKADPRDNGRDDRGDSRDRGYGNRNEERGQDRR